MRKVSRGQSLKALIAIVLFTGMTSRARGEGAPQQDPAALALAYEQAAASSARWGASYYEKLIALAPRFAGREAEVRSWARHFLRRCQRVSKLVGAAANAPASQFQGWDQRDLAWAGPELASWLKSLDPESGSFSEAPAWANSRPEILALIQRDQAWAKFAQTRDANPETPESLENLEKSLVGPIPPGPDFELILSRETIGEREVQERLRFYDPGRCLALARAAARRSFLKNPATATDAESAALLAALRGEASAPSTDGLAAAIQALYASDPVASRERLLSSKAADWLILSARWRARAGLELAEAESILEAEWQRQREAARPGPAGRRRLMVEGRPVLQALALIQVARAQNESESNLAALRALSLIEWLFAPGARGELASEDMRLALDLGDIYMQARRSKEALLYIYDAEAAIGALPYAACLRHFASELALLDALLTNDASRDEQLGKSPRELNPDRSSPHLLAESQAPSSGSLSPQVAAAPRGGQWRGWLVAGVGLALIGLAISRGLRS